MSFFTQIATYLTGKLNPIIERVNVLSSILPFPDRVNSGGKGFVFQVKQDESSYEWKQTPKLAPFIQSANPTLLDIDQTGIIITVKGSGFDPNTAFDLDDGTNSDIGPGGQPSPRSYIHVPVPLLILPLSIASNVQKLSHTGCPTP